MNRTLVTRSMSILFLAGLLIGLFGLRATYALQDTGNLGGVAVTVEDLAAMQQGQYILHAHGGRLTRIPVEKSPLPDSPPGDMVEIRTAVAPDGTIYFNGKSSICRSTDGGRSWIADSRGSGPAGEEISGTFQILSDSTFLCVPKDAGGKRTDPVPVWASDDQGITWQKISEIRLSDEYSERYVFGLFRLPDDTLLCGVGARNLVTTEHWEKWISGKTTLLLYRSVDRGRSWGEPRALADWCHEGGIICLPSGRLLAVLRYQRPLLPSDPEDLTETTGRRHKEAFGKLPPFPYKHIFLANSLDAGRSWQEFRQLTTVFGQCYGYPAVLSDGTVVIVHDERYPRDLSSARVMISRDEGETWEDEAYYLSRTQGMQSVVLEDDVILTILQTGEDHKFLQAIRWKLEVSGN